MIGLVRIIPNESLRMDGECRGEGVAFYLKICATS